MSDFDPTGPMKQNGRKKIYSPRHWAQKIVSIQNRDASWALTDQLLISGLSFIIGIVIARTVGIAEFGRIAIVILLAAQALTIQDNFLAAPMMTLVGRRARRTASYFGAVLAWGVILSIASGIAVAAIVSTLFLLRDGSVSPSFGLAAFLVTAAQSIHSTVRRLFFAQRRFGLALAVDAARYVGLLLIILVLGSAPGITRVDAPLILFTMAACVLISAGIYGLFTERPRLRWRLMSKVITRHWPIARWLVLMVIASAGQDQLVPLAITLLLGDAALGGLRAGQYLVGSTHFILMGMGNFVPQRAAEAYVVGASEGLRKYLIKETIVFGVPTVLLLLIIGVWAEFWLGHLFGPEYVIYSPILRIYCLTYFAIYLRDILIYYLRSIERTRATFDASAISSLVTIVLVYPLVWYAGLLGAALVVLAANITSLGCILAEVRRQHVLGLDRSLDYSAPL